MVTSNEGLEALATLASAVPAPSDGANGKEAGDNNDKNKNGSPQVVGQKSASPATTQGSGSSSPPRAPAQPSSAFQAPGAVQNPQQWQQALAAITAANAARNKNNLGNLNSNAQFSILANLQHQVQHADPAALASIQQQLNYFQLLQLAQNQQQQQPPPPPQPPQTTQMNPQFQALQLALAGQNIPGLAHLFGGAAPSVVGNNAGTQNYNQQQQRPPAPAVPSQVLPMAHTNNTSSANATSPPATVQSQHAAIAPQPNDGERDFEGQMEDRKTQKRAANRRSAQLSRKRKKQFIEELKDENNGLRRKEQILKSIPDLIVVFDSSGKLWFVSESVSRFLDFSAGELEGTSFWDRICEDSVRLLKAAFMDSLAARQANSDTAPLGRGFWELRLVDKDGGQKLVTLNGVVHFAGDRPECVCSIRPHEVHMPSSKVSRKEKALSTEETDSASSSGSSQQVVSAASCSKQEHHRHKSLIRVKPQQSVVSNGRSSSEASSFTAKRRGGSIRISDSGNSSGISDSGSSDELNNDTTS